MYYIVFALKNKSLRNRINFVSYRTDLINAGNDYNNACAKAWNPKFINAIKVYPDKIEFELSTQKPLRKGYEGLALRKYSQILVNNYSFLHMCTVANPKKLFVSV